MEAEEDGSRPVRNLGKPVELANRYFMEGADEVTFLNITGMISSAKWGVKKQCSPGFFCPMDAH